jgi:hypothetical protein
LLNNVSIIVLRIIRKIIRILRKKASAF